MTRPRLQGVPPQRRAQGPQPAMQPQPVPFPAGYRFIARYQILAAAVDTSGIGDIPLPAQGMSAIVVLRARDTSANAFASFGGLQCAVRNGAIDTTNNYDWQEVSGAPPAAVASAGGNGVGSLSAFVTAGGGQGGNAWARSVIEIPLYQFADQPQFTWRITQLVSTGGQITRSGAGNYRNPGPLSKLRFFSTAGNLASGTTFDVLAVMPAG